MAACVAGLAGFWYSLDRNQRKKVDHGTNAHYEQLLGHVGNHKQDAELPLLAHTRVPTKSQALELPKAEHNAQHINSAAFKRIYGSSPDRNPFQQPTPQRPRGDGSDHVYTKKLDGAPDVKAKEPEL
ncbi:hypothetical protein BDN72DRAFT_842665, partial [Pluteus cervinus]